MTSKAKRWAVRRSDGLFLDENGDFGPIEMAFFGPMKCGLTRIWI